MIGRAVSASTVTVEINVPPWAGTGMGTKYTSSCELMTRRPMCTVKSPGWFWASPRSARVGSVMPSTAARMDSLNSPATAGEPPDTCGMVMS
ncbi:hypothetical protein [Williamsia sp. CHRR-6]|uniref:hypothetical protein n=1 Tax=Williamsia sp. CHRR-6 TaxID=2835871 RepID=UPI001BDA9C6F|nr:hypothetical protein [Williamsia sp. CHRR-6]